MSEVKSAPVGPVYAESEMRNRKGKRIREGQMILNAPMTPEKAKTRLENGTAGAKEVRKWVRREWFTKEEVQKFGY